MTSKYLGLYNWVNGIAVCKKVKSKAEQQVWGGEEYLWYTLTAAPHCSMRQVAQVLLSPFYVQRANFFFCPKPHVAVWGVLLPTRLKSGYTRETRSLLSQNLYSGRGREGAANNKPKA